jgi:hypothetical protein
MSLIKSRASWKLGVEGTEIRKYDIPYEHPLGSFFAQFDFQRDSRFHSDHVYRRARGRPIGSTAGADLQERQKEIMRFRQSAAVSARI